MMKELGRWWVGIKPRVREHGGRDFNTDVDMIWALGSMVGGYLWGIPQNRRSLPSASNGSFQHRAAAGIPRRTGDSDRGPNRIPHGRLFFPFVTLQFGIQVRIGLGPSDQTVQALLAKSTGACSDTVGYCRVYNI